MTYQKEFPEFDPKTMPAIPEGFDDQSWGNDACPWFFNSAKHLGVWVDFADPDEREHEGGKRFSLFRMAVMMEDGLALPDSGEQHQILETDDWSEIVARIEKCPVMKPCRFSFDGGVWWDGHDLESQWNGFDNVALSPWVRDAIVQDIKQSGGDDDETAAELAAKPIDDTGLVSIAHGWASQIMEPNPPVYTALQLDRMGRETSGPAAEAEARGRKLFASGAPLAHMAVAAMEDDPQYTKSMERGWWDGHRVHYAEGAIAAVQFIAYVEANLAVREPKVPENPHPQFSNAWEAWADGFEATLAGAKD